MITDYESYLRVTEKGRIWWLVQDAIRLGTGFLPVRDDNLNLNTELRAPNNRTLANERTLLGAFGNDRLGLAIEEPIKFERDGYRDFKTFRPEQAIGFKKHLAKQRAQRSGQRLSKSTLHAKLTQLKHFFQWLAWQPGYKSRIQYADAEYFNLSEKEVRVATARRAQKSPTIEQIKHVLSSMPTTPTSSAATVH